MNWISVEEELPYDHEYVLLWLGGHGYKAWDIGWYRLTDNSWIDHRDEVCYPTHWTPVAPP